MLTLFLWILPLFLSSSNNSNCSHCLSQDRQYLCASNTLPINSRLCIDVSEVPAFVYKDYLQSLATEYGLDSEEFQQAEPDYEGWTTLFEGYTASELRSKFLDSDELALMPIIGISFQQAQAFAAWRTKAFADYLQGLPANERNDFPKKFQFRLPTENEWARIRFLYQDKKMIKQLEKIAKSNESSFKLKRSDLMNDSALVTSVFAKQDPDFGFFNIFNNVAEMTATEGIAMGGSWKEVNEKNDYSATFEYSGAPVNVGLRMIFEIKE